ncbi:hypothetical protein [Tichowtungia aerotolerans]|uniref:Uncharacterized protein n=1 Tax=Tichowtungia aerotolerans TaxID=2697043 RepID=A0A6P1M265_9BACT|nr:hypothetical protein [Tichowtungia aerotolerans]QHI68680.1 hypothetical protein GT409_04195 [Tichowtungia aerotolerans]
MLFKQNRNTQKSTYYFIVSFLLCLSSSSFATDGLYAGPVRIGGAARVNYSYRDWDEDYKEQGEFGLDTLRINLDLKTNNLIGSLEYRYYRDKHADGHDYHMLHHGWLGWEEKDWQVQVGVHQVPFGILPWASHNYFFQMAYYVGLEDDYDFGVKYIRDSGPWNVQLAYYVEDEGSWGGDSDDSARYSIDPVDEGGAGTEEQHQGNIRVAYTVEHSETHTSEFGASLQVGGLHNENSGDDGTHYAAALHLNETCGRWNLMLEALRYEYSALSGDPGGGRTITMGSYDYSYNVAAAGNIYSAGVAYGLPVEWGPITKLTFYNDFSILQKDDDAFSDSMQNILGCSVSAGRFFTYIDIASGKNQPWLGPNWTDGLGQGGDDGWSTRFNVNIGFYF